MDRVLENSKEWALPINSLEFANRCDEGDALREMRNEFVIPPPAVEGCGRDQVIYVCGNSLGLQPKGVEHNLQLQLKKWSEQGVEGHHEEPTPWITIDDIVQESMAKIVGAQTKEVVVMNSLTANLHLMMCAFYKPTETRFKIITEKRAFPSDTHAVVSQLKMHGRDENALVEVGPREGEATIRTEDILKVFLIFLTYFSFPFFWFFYLFIT